MRPGAASSNARELYAELVRFAGKGRKRFPSYFPEDTLQVLNKEKGLLSSKDSFSFACTGCGACCRNYSSTVILDPYDIHRMGIFVPDSRVDVSILYPKHFSRRIGLFELEALPHGTASLGGTLNGLPVKHTKGTAPVLFLAQQAKEEEKEAASARCAFSVPRPEGGLLCTLGPDKMPLSCSLYPLGYFMAGKRGADFFSVDNRGCEGLSKESPSSFGVHDYLAKGDMNNRIALSSWWQSLATSWTCSGVELTCSRVGAPLEKLRTLVAAAGVSVPSWLDVQENIVLKSSECSGPSPLLLAIRDAIRGSWYRGGPSFSKDTLEGETRRLYGEAMLVASLCR